MVFVLVCLLTGSVPADSQASIFADDCPTPAISAAGASYETAFSSDDQVAALVIKAIKSAKKSIKVVAHQFVSKPVSVALFEAARAGKEVNVVLDTEHNKDGYSDAEFMMTMGYPPHLLKGRGQLENYVIIDDSDLVLGNIAELQEADAERKNAVSVLVIHKAPELVKKYTTNWQELWAASEAMKEKKP